MSNAKWPKAFTAIAESPVEVRRCELKCIDSDHVTVVGRAPQVCELMERRFTDSIWHPFEYKWIEWFRFPRAFKPYAGGVGLTVTQDVEALRAIITEAAHVCVELDGEYLWLFGYRGGPAAVQLNDG